MAPLASWASRAARRATPTAPWGARASKCRRATGCSCAAPTATTTRCGTSWGGSWTWRRPTRRRAS
eukprot:14134902-Alexandrium_andersonii.AAC.1